MKINFLWALFLLALLTTKVYAQDDAAADGDAAGDDAAAEGDEEKEDELAFIQDSKTAKKLSKADGFTPNVMAHNDARDVLRKLVKEKDTAFIIQFYKGSPDRELREDIYRYALIPKDETDEYLYSSKYEYGEVDVDNSLYKDLVDNLSFKKKFQDDYPYVLYTFGGKGYMVHGPGAAREVFDLRKEVEKSAKKEEKKDDAAE